MRFKTRCVANVGGPSTIAMTAMRTSPLSSQNGCDIEAAVTAARARCGDQACQGVIHSGVGAVEGGDAQELGGQQLVNGGRRLLQPVRQVPARL